MSSLLSYYQNLQKTDTVKLKAASELSGVKETKLKKSPGLLMNLLDILDRPGNATRALLVGKLGGMKGLIPFAQFIEDMTGYDIALNDEDKVTGEEVLEKWTGIKDQKGKFDLADVLGFAIEVVADPLWLLGPVGGLTKTGEAVKAYRGLIRSADKVGDTASAMTKLAAQGIPASDMAKHLKNIITKDSIKDIASHFANGTPLTTELSGKMKKAIGRLYTAGGGTIPEGTLKAKNWAEQALAGERALLQIGLPGHRKTIIRGTKVLDKLDTIATHARTGWLGEKFLSPQRRVKTRNYDEFVDTVTQNARNNPAFQTRQQYSKIEDIMSKLDPDLVGKLDDYGEFAGGLKKASDNVEIINGLKSVSPEEALETLRSMGIKAGNAKGEMELVNSVDQIPEALDNARMLFQNTEKEMADNLTSLTKGIEPERLQRLSDAHGKVSEMSAEILSSEQARYLPSYELQSKFGYMPRIISNDLKKWIKKNELKTLTHKGRTFSVKHGNQTARDEILRDLTRSEIQDIYTNAGFKGKVFETPAASLAERAARAERVKGSADAIYESIRQFGDKGGDGVPVQQLFKDLEWKVPPEKALDLGLNTFDGITLDTDIYKALSNQYQIADKSAIDDIFKKTSSFFKTALTVGFPAYHARNALSNVALNFMAGVQNPNSYLRALKLQKAAGQTRRIMKKEGLDFFNAAKKVNWGTVDTAGGKMDGALFYRQLDEGNLLGEVAGHFAREETNPFIKMAGSRFANKTKTGIKKGPGDILYSAAQTVENNARIAHAIEKAPSMAIPDAVSSSKKALFDYGDLSEFEKDTLRDKVFLFYCVPQEYEILTRDGWKFHNELSIGQDVMGYDIDTQTCKWTKIEDVAVFPYNGELMRLYKNRGSNTEWLFTPNHRWPVRWHSKKEDKICYGHKMVEGKDLKTNHAVPYSAPFNDWPKESILTPREAAIVGWLITDGYMSKDGSNWRIYQSPKKYADEIRELIKGSNLKESIHPDSGVINFGLNKHIKKTLRDKGFNSKADAKKFVGYLSKEAAVAMWDAMYKADGTTSPNRTQDSFACMQDDVFDAAQMLVQLFGEHMHRSQKDGYIANKQGQWCKIENLDTKHYKGNVWCPKTGTGTWVMRANGKVIVTGNTFSRKNLEAQSKYLLSQPAKMAVFSKLAGGTPQSERRANLPKYMQERLDVPTPIEDAEGRTINLRGLGLPMEDAFGTISSPGTGLFDRSSRFVSRQLGRTMPFIKTPIELATKRSLFFDREIDNTGDFLKQSLPTSRVTNTYGNIVDPRQSWREKVVNNVIGVKATPQYDDYYKYLSEKETIEEKLRTNPEVKRFTRFYAEDKEKVSPGTKILLDRLNKR